MISQDQNEHEVLNAIHNFLCNFAIGKLLKTCNAMKQKGVPIMDVFIYKLCNAFTDRSMYMQMQTGVFNEDFSKNTVYRFMNDPKVNWLRFTSMLSRKAAESLEPLTDESRINAFVIDDTLFSRTGYKGTELASSLFDHVSGTHQKGFRLITLGWTDGNTFLPVNSSLLASSNPNSNFPDPENGLKPCPVLLAPSVLPPKYPSTCHRHSGKGLFDVSGHVFNELADKCLNLLVRYMENSVDALKHRTHNDL